MLNSTTLEVAIGMAFIYLLLSLFCTAINETIAGALGSRAKNLERGIQCLFTGGMKTNADDNTSGSGLTLAKAIYEHGLMQSLYRNTETEKSGAWFKSIGSLLPSYIPTRTFASVLLDVLFPDLATFPADESGKLTAMLTALDKIPPSKGKEAITTLVKQANGNVAATRKAFEQWYDDGMDRVSGWYKRRTQFVLFFIGITIAVGLNVNSVSIGRTLWISLALRSYSVASAEQFAKSQTAPTANASQTLSVLQSLSLPLGWSSARLPWTGEEGTPSVRFSSASLLIAIAGWLLTAIAMTLGAPFWFDLLNQFMVVRSTIKPQEKSEVEGSKDPTT